MKLPNQLLVLSKNQFHVAFTSENIEQKNLSVHQNEVQTISPTCQQHSRA